MTMELAQSRFVSIGYQLSLYAFSISCTVYLISRILWRFIHSDLQTLAPGSSLDEAEKGRLKKQEDMSDEEIFQLEKRAFFSKVGRPSLFAESPEVGGD